MFRTSRRRSHALAKPIALTPEPSVRLNKAITMLGMETLRVCIAHHLHMLVERLFAEATALVDETTRLVELSGDVSYMPELLRTKGSILLSISQSNAHDAQTCFMQSLELSRHHGARAWELRTATDLATLWASQGGFDDARALLQPVVKHFKEGAETADVKTAQLLLAKLG